MPSLPAAWTASLTTALTPGLASSVASGLVAALILALGSACQSPQAVAPGLPHTAPELAPHATLERFTFERPLLGTRFALVLFAATREQASAVAEAAFERVVELDALLSDYRPDSEVRQLTAGPADQGRPLSAELAAVLRAAQDLAERTDGAFDVTCGPLTRLWRRASRRGELPSPAALAEARQRVGWELLELLPAAPDADGAPQAEPPPAGQAPPPWTAKALVSGMRLDLGGLAKGYVLDEVLAACQRLGLEHALVDGGGDVACGPPPPGTGSWRVALEPGEADPDEATPVLLLGTAAVASSGDAYRFLELDGVRHSHLIDPRTGQALTDHAAATVVAPTGMQADGLASVLCLLTPDEGLALVAATPGVEARITRGRGADARTWSSPGFAALLAPEAPEEPEAQSPRGARGASTPP